MKNRTKNRVVSAFTLGYLLCLLNEKQFTSYEVKEKTKEQIFLFYRDEIITAIQSLYYSVFSELLIIKENPKSSAEFYETVKNIFNTIKEKNHWGDDSFLETAFLSGSFLSVVESFDEEQFNLHMFEQILTDLLNAINVNIDLKEFSRTVTKIKSDVLLERICSRDEIFMMISGKQQDHKSIVDIQYLIDNQAFLYSSVFA